MDGQMQNTVKKELAALKNSVTFAMSLGAQELFHTNFIAFILENDDPLLNNIRQNLGKLFGILITTDTKVYTWREKYNLDLVIIAIDWINHINNEDECDSVDEINNPQVCVIEAKLKSIPTLVQLDEYDQKLENGLRFDLNDSDYLQSTEHGLLTGFKLEDSIKPKTITPIYAGKTNTINTTFKKILLSQVPLPSCTWSQQNWNKVAKAIKKSGISTGHSGLSNIVEDYAIDLENLANLITGVINFSSNNFKTQQLFSYKELCDGINASQFKKIRIHDLVGKVVFNDLEQRLFKTINICQCKTLQINHSTFYSNQQPGINFEWCYEKPGDKRIFRIGVQIQGSDYRHYIATNTSWPDLKNLAHKIPDWFFATINKNNLHAKNGITKHNYIKNNFNQHLYRFDVDKFLYSKMELYPLEPAVTFDELEKAINKSLLLACETIDYLISNSKLDDYFK